MELEATKEKRDTYSEFTAIHAHYILTGDLDPARVRRAVQLSLDKYCSVSKLLEKTADITSSFSVNGVRYD
jgi:putative redox protein